MSPSSVSPYDTALYSSPEKFTGEPCVRWPPCERSIPRKVSPGLRKARKTAALAEAPLCGCTLACSAPKSCFTRSMASCSTWSTTSQPP
jgi:hypothetical protein